MKSAEEGPLFDLEYRSNWQAREEGHSTGRPEPSNEYMELGGQELNMPPGLEPAQGRKASELESMSFR